MSAERPTQPIPDSYLRSDSGHVSFRLEAKHQPDCTHCPANVDNISPGKDIPVECEGIQADQRIAYVIVDQHITPEKALMVESQTKGCIIAEDVLHQPEQHGTIYKSQ